MKSWRQLLINQSYTILKALELINANASHFVMVADENDVLLGTVTDGDVRRGLVKGCQLQDPVSKIMNSKPISFKSGTTTPQMEKFMKKKGINHVPFLDELGRIVDVISLDELNASTTKENTVVLMAGGLGSRLSTLTQNFPKPMLEVGGKPILENIIDIFKENGFSDFVISLNYKSEVIENYFQQGEKFGVKISYLKEDKPLGTAGALSLLKPKNDLPFIVMNGDLLTKLNFGELLNFHNFRKNDVTMCLRQYEHQVPFGVITTNGEKAVKIEEKPTKTYLVNGGIYVLNPSLLSRIPKNTYFDMTTFFDELITSGERVGAFPFYEYWIDIGRLDDFEKAHKDFIEVFKPKM